MKRTMLAIAAGTLGIVAAVFGNAQPLLAQQEAENGKLVSAGGVPGCDCNTKSPDCYCIFGS